MWHADHPAADQCEGCTFFNGQVRELSYLHSRDVTYATFCQGPYEESVRYRDFMGWDVPWYSAQESADAPARRALRPAMLVCYLRHGDRVFETYWTTRPRRRGDGSDVRAARPDGVRAAGAVGGLARAAGRSVGAPTATVPRPTDGRPRSGRASSRPGA